MGSSEMEIAVWCALACWIAGTLFVSAAAVLWLSKSAPVQKRKRARKTQLVPATVLVVECCPECDMARAETILDEPRFCQRCREEMGENEYGSFCRRCKSDPFPADTWARVHGWKIKHRPRAGPDLWTDAPNIFTPGQELTIGEVIGEIERMVEVTD